LSAYRFEHRSQGWGSQHQGFRHVCSDGSSGSCSSTHPVPFTSLANFFPLQTTFITTPLTLLFYPESYHHRKRIEIAQQNGSKIFASHLSSQSSEKSSFLVVLSQLEHLPSVMVRIPHSSSNSSSFFFLLKKC
jgi:hypothetical protein